MSENSRNTFSRDKIAKYTLLGGVSAIVILAITAIIQSDDKNTSVNILNMAFPVIASWVGTVLAFYFGKVNFESANKQVKDILDRLSPEERSNSAITSIMRPIQDLHYFHLDKPEKDVPVIDIKKLFQGIVSRMPVLDAEFAPKYMIHESSVDKYLLENKKSDANSLAEFIKIYQGKGIEFGVNKGFALVAKDQTIKAAKSKMKHIKSCQDIFITETGSPNEPLIGWVSNTRLAKYINS